MWKYARDLYMDKMTLRDGRVVEFVRDPGPKWFTIRARFADDAEVDKKELTWDDFFKLNEKGLELDDVGKDYDDNDTRLIGKIIYGKEGEDFKIVMVRIGKYGLKRDIHETSVAWALFHNALAEIRKSISDGLGEQVYIEYGRNKRMRKWLAKEFGFKDIGNGKMAKAEVKEDEEY